MHGGKNIFFNQFAFMNVDETVHWHLIIYTKVLNNILFNIHLVVLFHEAINCIQTPKAALTLLSEYNV